WEADYVKDRSDRRLQPLGLRSGNGGGNLRSPVRRLAVPKGMHDNSRLVSNGIDSGHQPPERGRREAQASKVGIRNGRGVTRPIWFVEIDRCVRVQRYPSHVQREAPIE